MLPNIFLTDHSGGSKRGRSRRAPSPTVQNFLNFMQFFGKFGKIIGRHPLPGGLAPPPTENPGSAPGPPLKLLTPLRISEFLDFPSRCIVEQLELTDIFSVT